MLQSGEIDVITRYQFWTTSRDVDMPFDFIGVNYYDGCGFMVRKDLCIKSNKDLSGASYRKFNTGTSTEINIWTISNPTVREYKPVIFENPKK